MEQKPSRSDVPWAFTRHLNFRAAESRTAASSCASCARPFHTLPCHVIMITSSFLTRDSPNPFDRFSILFFLIKKNIENLILKIWKKKKSLETSCDQWEKKNVVFILFSFICNVSKKKKKKKLAMTSMKNNNNNNYCGIIFYSVFKSQDRAKPLSHWADIPSQVIQDSSLWATELRSSHWAMIRPNQTEIQVIKPKFEPSSLWAMIRAKPSWAAFWVLFCYQTQDFIKIRPWVCGRMLRNIV